MIEDLLLKQLNLELTAAARMSYIAGATKDLDLRDLFLEFAKEELEHFSMVANILSHMGYESKIEPFTLSLETDQLKALIFLESLEDTMIHYYEDMIPELKQPFKDRIRNQVIQERDHKKKMGLPLEEAKRRIKAPPDPGYGV